MKHLIKKASIEQLDKLWQACYAITETCFSIEEANSPLDKIELRCKHSLISEADKLHMLILIEEANRSREETNEETSEEEEGAI